MFKSKLKNQNIRLKKSLKLLVPDALALLRPLIAAYSKNFCSTKFRIRVWFRCFKESFLKQKTRNSSLRSKNHPESSQHEEEALVARTTKVSLGRVKWNLTDKDGQLNLTQFEMCQAKLEKHLAVLYRLFDIF